MEESRREIKRYKRLFRMQLSENRFLIISRAPDGKLSMAQQVKIVDKDGRISYVIIKNAFRFLTDELFNEFRDGLQNLKLNSEINGNQLKIEI